MSNSTYARRALSCERWVYRRHRWKNCPKRNTPYYCDPEHSLSPLYSIRLFRPAVVLPNSTATIQVTILNYTGKRIRDKKHRNRPTHKYSLARGVNCSTKIGVQDNLPTKLVLRFVAGDKYFSTISIGK